MTTKMKDQYMRVSTMENVEKTEIQVTPAAYGYGIRHIQMAITFVCACIIFIARAHLGVTIVAMTSHKLAENTRINITDIDMAMVNGTEIEANMTIDEVTPRGNDTMAMEYDTNLTIYRTYYWSKPIQETVLSSFFLGYCIMNFPMALVCQRWGGKLPIQIALIINGLLSLFTPWFTLWGGWKALSICRMAQGLTQAGTFPGIQTLLANWVPVSERATMSSYVYAGPILGNIISFQLSGILADTAWGWPSTYWTIGVLNVICFVFLTMFGTASPLEHKTITEEERNYITGHINTGVPQKRKAPWKSILSSKPAWANFVAHSGSGVTYVFLLSQVPSFIHYIRGMDVKNSGILSSLPYIASFFSTVGFGFLSDYLTNRNILSVKTARRVFNSIANVGVAVMLICASFASSISLTVVCFILALSCNTSLHSGWMLNHIDLSPRYSGTLMAIGNTMMNLFVTLTPILVANIVIDLRNPYQWRTMLSIIAGIAFITNIVFVIFLSTDTQSWNEGKIDEAEIEGAKEKPLERDTEFKK